MPKNALEIGRKRYYRCPAHPQAKYVSVTTGLGRTNDFGLASGWAAKITAERAFDDAEHWLNLPREEALRYLKAAHRERRDKAADAGTLAHDAAERIISGIGWRDAAEDAGLPERLHGLAQIIEDWWTTNHYEVVLVERTVYHHLLRYAGTLDALVVDPEGRHWVLDWKTQGYRDPAKWRLQLAAYANADDWVDEDDQLHPLPEIAGGIVVWLPQDAPERGKVVKLDVGIETRAVWLSTLMSWGFLTGTPEDDGEVEADFAEGTA